MAAIGERWTPLSLHGKEQRNNSPYEPSYRSRRRRCQLSAKQGRAIPLLIGGPVTSRAEEDV